jgi:hypothetical protein
LKFIAVSCLVCSLLLACSQDQNSSAGGDNFLHPPTKAPTSTLYAPKEIDLSDKIDPQGKAIAPLTLDAPDGCLRLEVDQGTAITNSAGQPAKSLVIQQDYPGKLPIQAYGVAVSYAYRFGPEELHFSSPVKIIFSCLKNYKKTLVSETSLGIKGDSGKWDQLSVQGDEATIWTRLDKIQPDSQYILVGPAPMGS